MIVLDDKTQTSSVGVVCDTSKRWPLAGETYEVLCGGEIKTVLRENMKPLQSVKDGEKKEDNEDI